MSTPAHDFSRQISRDNRVGRSPWRTPTPDALYRYERLPPVVFDPDAMMAEMRPRIRAIVIAAPHIMPGDPTSATFAEMSRNPHPVIPLVPVAPTMIIWPVAYGD